MGQKLINLICCSKNESSIQISFFNILLFFRRLSFPYFIISRVQEDRPSINVCRICLISFSKIFLFYFFHNVLLVSGIQQSEAAIHVHISTLFLRSFSHTCQYRVLNRVPCAMSYLFKKYKFSLFILFQSWVSKLSL